MCGEVRCCSLLLLWSVEPGGGVRLFALNSTGRNARNVVETASCVC